MPPRDPQLVLQKLGQASLKVDTYFLQKTGFIANQTILKLGEYNLNCVPATLGLEESRFLAVLTPVEIGHFARFKTGIHTLILTFDDPDNKDIARFPLRVALIDLQPVPERKNVCFLLLKLKSLPSEFILFLGAYYDALEGKKQSWEALSKAAPEPFTASSRLAAEATVEFQDLRASVTLVALQTHTIQLGWPEPCPDWAHQAGVHLRLSLRGRPLSLEGTLDADGAFRAEFHVEWLEFLEGLKLSKSLKHPDSARAPA